MMVEMKVEMKGVMMVTNILKMMKMKLIRLVSIEQEEQLLVFVSVGEDELNSGIVSNFDE